VDTRSEQATALDELKKESLKNTAGWPDGHLAKVLPFFESVVWGRKDFSWEREWRLRGSFGFDESEVVLVIAPEKHHWDLRKDFSKLHLIDPDWSLQRMITAPARGVPQAP